MTHFNPGDPLNPTLPSTYLDRIGILQFLERRGPFHLESRHVARHIRHVEAHLFAFKLERYVSFYGLLSHVMPTIGVNNRISSLKYNLRLIDTQTKGKIFLKTDDNPLNLKVAIGENDFARVIYHGVTLQKILFPPLMSLHSNLYVISVCK